ncbi:MAG TPA: tubulin/FtsZ family protein [Methanoculleus sp.]|nr:tubulin/FtsZ family protein [Methanoculleus sp.]
MRVLTIGLGGAGSRVVDKLYDHDRRSGVHCTNAVVIDVDPNSLLQLSHLPNDARIFFPGVNITDHAGAADVIDIDEVMTRLQRMDTIEIDSILICCGLGGSVIDIAPFIIEKIRVSYVEPIFALAILPCLSEGKRVSAKAADDLEMLQELVDGVILFDNETWSRKLLACERPESAGGSGRRRQPLEAPDPRTHYNMLNERIARQVGLLLRAGEFNEGGVEVAEVVLDAGEVLNTLKDGGLVAVGYATERLPTGLTNLLRRRRSLKDLIQGSHERTARIISLAKRAVYEDISIPCDLTSADKALVLIAGPSAELSMKGFHAVRKWIDRSIAGLEMRSGDYPVRNTAYVGIIVVLSGLSNIPRVGEIQNIRADYMLECEEEASRAPEDLEGDDHASSFEVLSPDEAGYTGDETMMEKDEMIDMPAGAGTRQKDETIDISPKPGKREEDGGLSLPPRESGREIDLAGSASVTSSVPAPKNSTFDLKGIRVEKTAPRDDGMSGSASFKPVQRPKEGALSGERVTFGHGQRPRDDLFDEAGVRMHGGVPAPKDRLPGGAARQGPRPKEVEPGRGKLRVLDAAAREEEEPDDGITWIL